MTTFHFMKNICLGLAGRVVALSEAVSEKPGNTYRKAIIGHCLRGAWDRTEQSLAAAGLGQNSNRFLDVRFRVGLFPFGTDCHGVTEDEIRSSAAMDAIMQKASRHGLRKIDVRTVEADTPELPGFRGPGYPGSGTRARLDFSF